MANAGLRVEGLSFSAAGRAIVSGVSLTVTPGETLAVVGPSGCGKTTLLRLIAGLDRPDAGAITFDGADIVRQPAHKRGFGMMFQEFALFPHLSVEQNVAFGLRHSRFPRSMHRARVAELLELTGLAGFEKRTIEKLSGGERQRVALARSLAPEPQLLMLDEPLGSLDRGLRERLLVELKAILGRLQIPTLYVTHDQFEAFAIGASMAVMREGGIVRTGTPQDVYREPRTEFVARFLGLENIIAGERDADGTVHTKCGSWAGFMGSPGPVTLLLRNEGATIAREPGPGTASGVLQSRIFQGAEVHIQVETEAGRLEFALPSQAALPADGAPIAVSVPAAQLLG